MWNVAVFDGFGVDTVLTYPCAKDIALNLANEMNRWMSERKHWKSVATYIAFPVPCVG